MLTTYEMRALGVIHTPHREAVKTPIQPCFAEKVEGVVELDPALAEGLHGLEDFSHVFLLYKLHQATFQSLKVTPYLVDEPKGIFACRYPHRPNGIGLSLVKLVCVEDRRLVFLGADMLDGTPLLDIKPYFPKADRPESSWGGWTENIDKESAMRRGQRLDKKAQRS